MSVSPYLMKTPNDRYIHIAYSNVILRSSGSLLVPLFKCFEIFFTKKDRLKILPMANIVFSKILQGPVFGLVISVENKK